MAKVVLITGISGFVGPRLAAYLIAEEKAETVIGVTRRRADLRKPKNIIDAFASQIAEDTGFKLEFGDVINFTSIAGLIQKYQPDWIFHLASQSFVPESIRDPMGTFETNCGGTQNVLEAVRLFSPKSRVIFAGSSEEYGLQFKNPEHYHKMKEKYGQIEPEPQFIKAEFIDNKTKMGYETESKMVSELPINEQSVLRPMSPYAVSKVFGDNLCRNYYNTFGIDTVVSRAFNHEGAGRGDHFVTSSIVRQLCAIRNGDSNSLIVGDTSVTRDWSHVKDIIEGYILLAEKAEPGSIYVQGTGIETSIEGFIFEVQKQLDLYRGDDFEIIQNPDLMRPSDVPHLQADPTKIRNLGFKNKYTIQDIIKDQIVYYSDPQNRKNILV